MNTLLNQLDGKRDGRVIRTLKDGYWDITEVIEAADGTHRVRKRTKGSSASGPWGVESLRREIRFLRSLSSRARVAFPEVLAAWDSVDSTTHDIGYEIPFYAHHTDAGELARRGALPQSEVDEFQDLLAEALLHRVHEPSTVHAPLSQHMIETMRHAIDELASQPAFKSLIEASSIELNGRRALGPRAALDRLVTSTDAFVALDAVPPVRLHGDFFLENILWSPASAAADTSRLILIDPVSVAGISVGPPLFDFVKYESYATGELLGLRTGCVAVSGFADERHCYHWRIRDEDPTLANFKSIDWHSRFQHAFEVKHGAVDRRLADLIDGYFSLAMAVNTTGVQRQARLLKGTTDLNAALN